MDRSHSFRHSGLSLLLILTGSALAQVASAAVPDKIEFNRDIRPIFSDKCYTCHGPDKSHRVTEFHFDVEESAKQDLGNGHFAVFPGDLTRSALIQRVTETDVKRRMPPASTGRNLTEREISLLKKWVEQGAKWEKHWSFEPPQRPQVPAVTNTTWVRNPIDNFVLSRLDKEGLKPSREADRLTLLRRVTLDLTGKGPTQAEMDAFLADRSPQAYEKVVDRLLTSPHYGERMAMPWLDASRYADTDGYQVDYERYMWRWRDWVIDAFNRNMPFDQFTVEQLAGDLLPNPTLDQKIATAFNRNHRTNGEGGIIAEEFAAEYVVDRVATTSSVFLGLTMGCARCHDHKYDPLSQKEFYQFFAYFNNVPELGRARRGNSDPFIKAPTPQEQVELGKMDDQIKAAHARYTKIEPAVSAAEAAWLKTFAGGQPRQWAPSRGLVSYFALDGNLEGKVMPNGTDDAKVPVAPATWKNGSKFAPGVIGQAANFDGANFIEAGDIGGFDDNSKVTMSAWIYPTSGDGAILTKTVDEPEGKGYNFHLKDGKLAIDIAFRWIDHGLRVESEKPLELNRWHHVAFSYGGARASRSVSFYVDGERQGTKILMDILNESPRLKEPLRIGGGTGPANRFHGMIADVRIYNREVTLEEVGILSASRSLNELATVPVSQRTPAEANKIRSAFLENGASPDIRATAEEVFDAQERRDKFYERISTLMVMQEMPVPRETHVLLRGSYDAPGDVVTPNVPAILPPVPADFPRNRLGLARWLVSASNPLTARVAVNRFWQMYFGQGIVKTVDDFGSQGDAPSNPELLDWLATEFVRTGWNIREMQRTIVLSATYRQTSEASPELIQRDPENRLLARGARFRLPAETVRDQALAAAGLLVENVGGPSVMTYQPEGLWADLIQDGVGRDHYVQDHGDKLYRRSLYTFWKRTIPPPTMANFDAPTRDSCILQRSTTNSPLQALDLMNDVIYLEAARVLGQRMVKEGGTAPDKRIAFAFRLTTGRVPTAKETGVLSGVLHDAQDRFQTKPESALKLLAQGEYPRDPKLDVKELAAYTEVASLILNLDETLSRQ
jgi:hypothetical protein